MAERLVPVNLAQVDVRADDPSSLPFEPPDANHATTWGERDVLWLGPDEWLVVGAAGTEHEIVGELQDRLAGRHRSIVDVSANRLAFDLDEGPDLLSFGCGLDLHPDHWTAGMCAQTLFGNAQVILHQLDPRTTRVFVRPSFAGYFVARLSAGVS